MEKIIKTVVISIVVADTARILNGGCNLQLLFFLCTALAGNMNMGIYDADCEFADPFVSFKGLKRFKQNVSNLGSFMEESSLKITDWQEYEVHNRNHKTKVS